MQFNPITYASNVAIALHDQAVGTTRSEPRRGLPWIDARQSAYFQKRQALLKDKSLNDFQIARGLGRLDQMAEGIRSVFPKIDKTHDEKEFYTLIVALKEKCDALKNATAAQLAQRNGETVLLEHMAHAWHLRPKDTERITAFCQAYPLSGSNLIAEELQPSTGFGGNVLLEGPSGKKAKVGQINIVEKPPSEGICYPVLHSSNSAEGKLRSLSIHVSLNSSQLRDEPYLYFYKMLESADLDFDFFITSLTGKFADFFNMDEKIVASRLDDSGRYEFVLRSLVGAEHPAKENGFREIALVASASFGFIPFVPWKEARVKLILPDGKVMVNYAVKGDIYAEKDTQNMLRPK